jgi:hypothetical protein
MIRLLGQPLTPPPPHRSGLDSFSQSTLLTGEGWARSQIIPDGEKPGFLLIIQYSLGKYSSMHPITACPLLGGGGGDGKGGGHALPSFLIKSLGGWGEGEISYKLCLISNASPQVGGRGTAGVVFFGKKQAIC